MTDPTHGQPQWQQPLTSAQQYPPQMGYPQQPQAPYPPQMGYPQQPYGQPLINVNIHQGHATRSVTHAYVPKSWHVKHWILMVFTGFLSTPWYLWGLHKRRRPLTITTHE